jgi:hypothetical protein
MATRILTIANILFLVNKQYGDEFWLDGLKNTKHDFVLIYGRIRKFGTKSGYGADAKQWTYY